MSRTALKLSQKEFAINAKITVALYTQCNYNLYCICVRLGITSSTNLQTPCEGGVHESL